MPFDRGRVPIPHAVGEGHRQPSIDGRASRVRDVGDARQWFQAAWAHLSFRAAFVYRSIARGTERCVRCIRRLSGREIPGRAPNGCRTVGRRAMSAFATLGPKKHKMRIEHTARFRTVGRRAISVPSRVKGRDARPCERARRAVHRTDSERLVDVRFRFFCNSWP